MPAEEMLGTVGIARRILGAAESQRASRAWWDADAADYLAEHGSHIGVIDFVWCPEGLREADARLLGDVRGRAVLEIGCGSAPCARRLAAQGARTVALDLSGAMLAHAAAIGVHRRPRAAGAGGRRAAAVRRRLVRSGVLRLRGRAVRGRARPGHA